MSNVYHVTREPDEANYVYDVYYAEGGELADFDDSLLDGLVSLQPFNTGLDSLYDEYRLERYHTFVRSIFSKYEAKEGCKRKPVEHRIRIKRCDINLIRIYL